MVNRHQCPLIVLITSGNVRPYFSSTTCLLVILTFPPHLSTLWSYVRRQLWTNIVRTGRTFEMMVNMKSWSNYYLTRDFNKIPARLSASGDWEPMFIATADFLVVFTWFIQWVTILSNSWHLLRTLSIRTLQTWSETFSKQNYIRSWSHPSHILSPRLQSTMSCAWCRMISEQSDLCHSSVASCSDRSDSSPPDYTQLLWREQSEDNVHHYHPLMMLQGLQ